jgi:hypothetical protein
MIPPSLVFCRISHMLAFFRERWLAWVMVVWVRDQLFLISEAIVLILPQLVLFDRSVVFYLMGIEEISDKTHIRPDIDCLYEFPREEVPENRSGDRVGYSLRLLVQ